MRSENTPPLGAPLGRVPVRVSKSNPKMLTALRPKMTLRKSMWYQSALTVSPFICHLRVQVRIAANRLFDRGARRSKRGTRRSAKRIAGKHCGWIIYGHQDLPLGSIQFGKGWSVISFAISAAQGQRRIDGLPAKEKLGLFRRTEIAVVIKSFLVPQFQAVETRVVPDWTRDRNTNLPVERPDISAPSGWQEVRHQVRPRSAERRFNRVSYLTGSY